MTVCNRPGRTSPDAGFQVPDQYVVRVGAMDPDPSARDCVLYWPMSPENRDARDIPAPSSTVMSMEPGAEQVSASLNERDS